MADPGSNTHGNSIYKNKEPTPLNFNFNDSLSPKNRIHNGQTKRNPMQLSFLKETSLSQQVGTSKLKSQKKNSSVFFSPNEERQVYLPEIENLRFKSDSLRRKWESGRGKRIQLHSNLEHRTITDFSNFSQLDSKDSKDSKLENNSVLESHLKKNNEPRKKFIDNSVENYQDDSGSSVLVKGSELKLVEKIRRQISKDNVFLMINFNPGLPLESNLDKLEKNLQQKDCLIELKETERLIKVQTQHDIKSNTFYCEPKFSERHKTTTDFLTNSRTDTLAVWKWLDKMLENLYNSDLPEENMSALVMNLSNNNNKTTPGSSLYNKILRKSNEEGFTKNLMMSLRSLIELPLGPKILSKEFLKKLELILTSGIDEIIRQIAIECNERGKLIKLIWALQTSILNEKIIEVEKASAMKEHSLMRIEKVLHLSYQRKIEELNEETKRLKAENEISEKEKMKYKQCMIYFRKKFQRTNEELKEETQRLEILRKQYEALLGQIISYKTLLEEKNLLTEAMESYINKKKEFDLLDPMDEEHSHDRDSQRKKSLKDQDIQVDDKIYLFDEETDTIDLIKLENKEVGGSRPFNTRDGYFQTKEIQTEGPSTVDQAVGSDELDQSNKIFKKNHHQGGQTPLATEQTEGFNLVKTPSYKGIFENWDKSPEKKGSKIGSLKYKELSISIEDELGRQISYEKHMTNDFQEESNKDDNSIDNNLNVEEERDYFPNESQSMKQSLNIKPDPDSEQREIIKPSSNYNFKDEIKENFTTSSNYDLKGEQRENSKPSSTSDLSNELKDDDDFKQISITKDQAEEKPPSETEKVNSLVLTEKVDLEKIQSKSSDTNRDEGKTIENEEMKEEPSSGVFNDKSMDMKDDLNSFKIERIELQNELVELKEKVKMLTDYNTRLKLELENSKEEIKHKRSENEKMTLALEKKSSSHLTAQILKKYGGLKLFNQKFLSTEGHKIKKGFTMDVGLEPDDRRLSIDASKSLTEDTMKSPTESTKQQQAFEFPEKKEYLQLQEINPSGGASPSGGANLHTGNSPARLNLINRVRLPSEIRNDNEALKSQLLREIEKAMAEESSESEESFRSEELTPKSMEAIKRKQARTLTSKQNSIISIKAPRLKKSFTSRNLIKPNLKNEPSSILLEKVLEKKNKTPKEVQASMSKNTLLKIVSNIFTERLKCIHSYRMPLYHFIYELFLQKYGLKKVAESKFQQFLESCLFFSTTERIIMFCKFIMLDEDSYGNDELIIYLITAKKIDEIYKTGAIFLGSSSEKVFAPIGKIVDSIKDNYQSLAPPSELYQAIKKIEDIQVLDSKKVPVVEFDVALKITLILYRSIKKRARKHSEDIFYAADLDQDGQIEFTEFVCLFRCVEPNNFTNQLAKSLFFEASDIVIPESGEKALSFDSFVALAIENRLFTEEKQKAFAKKIHPKDKIKSFETLKTYWPEKKKELKLRLIKSKKLETFYQRIIKGLDKSLFDPSKQKSILWMSYRLLEEETKSLLLDYYTSEMIPWQLDVLKITIEKILMEEFL